MAAKKLGAISKTTTPVVVRAGIFMAAFLGVSGYIMSQISDVGLLEVVPYFLVAIGVQFIPFLVRTTPEPFEPPGLASVTTLIALIPCLTGYIVNGGVQINLLPQVSGSTRIELVQTVMIAYVIGTLSYFGGYYVGIGKRISGIFPDMAGGTWKRSRLIHVCIVGAALFIPAYAYFQARVGARITDVTQLAAGKAVWREDASLSWLLRAVGLGFVPPLLLVALNFPKFRWARAIATVALFGVVSFLTVRLGQRGTTVYCILNALIIVHYLGRRIPLSVLAGIGFSLIVVTNLLGEYRQARDDQYTASAAGPTANFDATTTLAEHEDDRERVAAVAVVFHYFPDRKDYLLGESWGPVLTMFIPRWIWPDKGYLFLWRETAIVRQLVGAPVPVSYLGLLYANFSWVGIVLGMFGWGAFQRGLYEWFIKHDKDKTIVILYSVYLLYVGPTLLQLSSAIGLVLPIYVALRYIRTAPPKANKRAALGPRSIQGPAALVPSPGPAAAE